jgi:ubiquinone biosynthesis UbiH/UbiF/VisC/COQ6 family hydroxylase
LTLADGRSLQTRLVVAADGIRSWVREQAGIEAHVKDYRQLGVVANFRVQDAHRQIARQWFRADGVLALLPLPGKQVSMVWSTGDDNAQRLLGLGEAEFTREVEAAAEHALGEMALISAPTGFPLSLTQVSEIVRPRLALIGDAAHSVHPLAGQGVNLGFQDANALARTLLERGAQDDCGDLRLLRRYARSRKESVIAMQSITDALLELFAARGAAIGWVRNTGLTWTDRLLPIKRALIEHALG